MGLPVTPAFQYTDTAGKSVCEKQLHALMCLLTSGSSDHVELCHAEATLFKTVTMYPTKLYPTTGHL